MIVILINLFLFSPRDSTGGLGVKMVEYVLGGSPTNKDSPLALDGRFKNLKIDEVKVSATATVSRFFFSADNFKFDFHLILQGGDDKEANSSPFDNNNGLKKDDIANGSNGLEDDKGFK